MIDINVGKGDRAAIRSFESGAKIIFGARPPQIKMEIKNYTVFH